jgi:hypothetical protein
VLLIALQVAVAVSAPSDKAPVEHRIDTRLGMLTGGNDIGDVTGPSSGLYATAGYRWGDATMMVEYDYLHVGDAESDATDRDGRMSRGSANLRWTMADVARRGAPVGLEFWLEGGAGVERVSWDHGGLLYRPDLALGFGLDLDGRGWREPHPRHFGAFLAFRALVARAPETDGPAMCEGPCTIATAPSRNDVGLYFLFGLHWGR